MIAWIVLVIVNILFFFNTNEDERFREVKMRYKKLRDHLKSKGIFPMIHEEIPIIAHYKMTKTIGYNANKGSEIGLCIDGTINDILHVLFHELAHCTVEEYSHSKEFWTNFDKIKEEAISIGIYENILTRTPFCGKHIIDK